MNRAAPAIAVVERNAARIGFAIALVAVATASIAIWSNSPSPSPSLATPDAGARWGIDQLTLRRTANGHMLDLRYRVVDPRRAESLLAEESEAYLIHAASGRRLSVPDTPKAGRLRTRGTPEAGRSYFALFANPGRFVQRGDRVSVVLGDFTTQMNVE